MADANRNTNRNAATGWADRLGRPSARRRRRLASASWNG
jgi:hypothetical protein